MTPAEMEAICAMVHARSGVVIDTSKTYLVESRLAALVRREGFATLSDLVQAIRASRDQALMWAVTEALSAGETSFFRDSATFAHFRNEVLPALAARRGERPIRVWSAACSSGQEAYSLAMIIDDMRAELPGARIEVFGSDIAEARLEKAQSGLYSQFEVQRGLPIRQLVRNFEKVDDMWALSPRIRQLVRWRRINLLADLLPLGRFDVIFCRYAVCDFDAETRRRVLEHLSEALPDDGRLILGAQETVADMTDRLIPVGQPGVFGPNPAHRASGQSQASTAQGGLVA